MTYDDVLDKIYKQVYKSYDDQGNPIAIKEIRLNVEEMKLIKDVYLHNNRVMGIPDEDFPEIIYWADGWIPLVLEPSLDNK